MDITIWGNSPERLAYQHGVDAWLEGKIDWATLQKLEEADIDRLRSMFGKRDTILARIRHWWRALWT